MNHANRASQQGPSGRRSACDQTAELTSQAADPVAGPSRIAQKTGAAFHLVVDAIRTNPGPALAMGAGFAWLIYRHKKASKGNDQSYGIYGDGFSAREFPDWPVKAGSDADPAALAGEYWGTGHEGLDATEGSDPLTASYEGSVHHDNRVGIKAKMGALASQFREKTAHFRERSHDWGERTQHRSHELFDQGRRRVARAVQAHPLSVGLGFVAIGILAGLLLPPPRRVTESVRPQAHRLRERAKEAGQDLAVRGRRAANPAKQAFNQAARAKV